jgi:hypothetical protein
MGKFDIPDLGIQDHAIVFFSRMSHELEIKPSHE